MAFSVAEIFVKRSVTVRTLLARRGSTFSATNNANAYSRSTPELPIRNVLIYDGVCNLCNVGVRFVLPRTSSELKFCAAQTRKGAEVLNSIKITQSDVMKQFAYVDDCGKIHRASTAALEVAKHMTWPWSVFHIFIGIPPKFRDAIYNVIAKHRYNMFGRTTDCQLPPKEIRDRFL